MTMTQITARALVPFVIALLLAAAPALASTAILFSDSFETGDFRQWDNFCRHYAYVTGVTYTWTNDQLATSDMRFEGSYSLATPNERKVNKKFHLGVLTNTANALWYVPSCVYKGFAPIDVLSTPIDVESYIYDTLDGSNPDSFLTTNTAFHMLNGQWICNDYGTGDEFATDCSVIIAADSISMGMTRFNNEYYGVFAEGNQVQRTVGWHRFLYRFTGDGRLEAYIDETLVYSGSSPITELRSFAIVGDGQASNHDSIMIIRRNRAPMVTTPAPISVREGQLVTVEVTATDADGDSLAITYDWPLDTTGAWQTTKGTAGTYETAIHVSDGETTTTVEASITVTENRPPTIASIENMTIPIGTLVRIDPVATDPDGDMLTFTYSSPLDENGAWTPTESDVGQRTMSAQVSDGEYNVTEDFTITVQSKEYRITYLKDNFLVDGNSAQSSTCLDKDKKTQYARLIEACNSIVEERDKMMVLLSKSKHMKDHAQRLESKYMDDFKYVRCDALLEGDGNENMFNLWTRNYERLRHDRKARCHSASQVFGDVTMTVKNGFGEDSAEITSIAQTSVTKNTFVVEDKGRYPSMKIKIGDEKTTVRYYPRVKMTKITEDGQTRWVKGKYHLELVVEGGTMSAQIVQG